MGPLLEFVEHLSGLFHGVQGTGPDDMETRPDESKVKGSGRTELCDQEEYLLQAVTGLLAALLKSGASHTRCLGQIITGLLF